MSNNSLESATEMRNSVHRANNNCSHCSTVTCVLPMPWNPYCEILKLDFSSSDLNCTCRPRKLRVGQNFLQRFPSPHKHLCFFNQYTKSFQWSRWSSTSRWRNVLKFDIAPKFVELLTCWETGCSKLFHWTLCK